MSISDSSATHPWNSSPKDMSAQSRLNKRLSTPHVYGWKLRRFYWGGLCVFCSLAMPRLRKKNRSPARKATRVAGRTGHLFEDWGGERSEI